ncbi:MAG TPA: pyridoxamine 5'-phosphate oxidase family protein [Magnetospirillaceae bacterium]|nr:pyridoxamine 5'-phosphate oxidase family protein [Magnetospirillaceae bacterium]
MEYREILSGLKSILEESKVGVLTVVDDRGYPHSRWMTPALLPRFPGRIFTVTCPRFEKVRYIAANPKVEWLFQGRTLECIVTVKGRAFVVDEPELKVEVLEAIGPNLQVFWRMNPKAGDLVVVETEIEEAEILFPLRQDFFRAEAIHV